MDAAAANMSGITTTQSKIAEDLDSFIYASWFSSTYLVCEVMRSINYFDIDIELDRSIKSGPGMCSVGPDLLSANLHPLLSYTLRDRWACHLSGPQFNHLPSGQSHQRFWWGWYDDHCLDSGSRTL